MSSLDFEAIALDFDGVLADTISAHTQARTDAMVKMSEISDDSRFADISAELHDQAHSHGSTPEAIIGWLLMEAGITQSIDDPVVARAVSIKTQLYWEHAKHGLDPIEGAVPFVKRSVVHCGGGLALVTTATVQAEVAPFLRKHRIEHHFRTIVAKEHIRGKDLKPHPKAYEMMLRRMNKKSTEVIAVEDSPTGIQAARAANITVAAITTTHSAEVLDALGEAQHPDYIVANFDELAELLGFE